MDAGEVVAVAVAALMAVAGQLFWPKPGRGKRINKALSAQRATHVYEGEGPVRWIGRARGAGELLVSPLSGRLCVAYEVVVIELLGNRRWHTLEDKNALPFIVADETGEAIVDMSGAFRLTLVPDHKGYTSWGDAFPGKSHELARFLQAIGAPATNWRDSWRPFHFSEGVIEEGDLVSVSGTSAWEIDPLGERRDPRRPPERLVLRGSEERPVLISDAPEALQP